MKIETEEIVKSLLYNSRKGKYEREADKTTLRTSPQNITGDPDSISAHRVSIGFKEDKKKFSGDPENYIKYLVANHNQEAIGF